MGPMMSKPSTRHSSSFSIEPAEKLELTDECHHYQARHEVNWDIQKYLLSRMKFIRRPAAYIRKQIFRPAIFHLLLV
jgi:hypothetical protein